VGGSRGHLLGDDIVYAVWKHTEVHKRTGIE